MMSPPIPTMLRQHAALGRGTGLPFPYLYDATQAVAKAYGAVCTPDFFGYNARLQLQYRGRLDASGRIPAQRMPGANCSRP
jgi:peroxiredoxin